MTDKREALQLLVHQRIGKLEREYDGSIIMYNQVIGKIAADHSDAEEYDVVCREIVRTPLRSARRPVSSIIYSKSLLIN